MSNNSEYAGNPLELTPPKRDSALDWAISRNRPKGKSSTTPKERPERSMVESNPFKYLETEGSFVFDSDTILITDNEVLTRCAAKYYNTFKVPTMIVDSAKKKRRYTSEDKADLDIFCFNDNIGVIVNQSQKLNTIQWHRINKYGDWKGAMEAYYDNCLLSILSEIAI